MMAARMMAAIQARRSSSEGVIIVSDVMDEGEFNWEPGG